MSDVQISDLTRELRSSRTDVHYHLTPTQKTVVTEQPNSAIKKKYPSAPAPTPEFSDESSPSALDLRSPLAPSGGEGAIPVFQLDVLGDASDNNIDIIDTESPALQHQQPLGADNLDIAPIINTRMAEDRALLPHPFTGQAQSDASEFWRRLTSYLAFKDINDDAEKLKLARAMLVSDAADWLEALPNTQKSTFDQLKEAFEKHYIMPTALRFKSASELFKRRQAISESVDEYAGRIRSLSKKIQVADSTLLYAFVSGLRPNIATFVLTRNPDTLQAAIDDARIAEISAMDAPSIDNSHLNDQLAQMRNDLQRLAQRFDSMPVSAPISERPRVPPQNSPQGSPRRVVFRDPLEVQEAPRFRERPRSPIQRNDGAFRAPYSRGGARAVRGNTRGGRQPFFEQRTEVNATQKCGKCGLNQHTNVNFCPAINQQCLYCAKFGHFRRVCRSAKRH